MRKEKDKVTNSKTSRRIPRPMDNPDDRPVQTRDEEVRKNYHESGLGRVENPDFDSGHADTQEVEDNNINQYTTGRPN